MEDKYRILVYFIEPIRYGIELISNVYEKTDYEYKYIYGTYKELNDEELSLPENALLLNEAHNKKKIIKDALGAFKPHVVIINGYYGADQVFLIKICQKKHIPYCIESDTPLHIPSSRIKAAIKKIYLKRLLDNRYCYGFPGGTPQQRNLEYYGIAKEKNFIMPMSIDNDRFRAVIGTLPCKEELLKKYGMQGKRVLLYVGRLVEEKNVELLIHSYYSLKEIYDDIGLIIVGDGQEKDKLIEEVINPEKDKVLFVGFKKFPGIMEFYKMAHVFVLPSKFEPWGLVVNEALSVGVPVVVSDAVGCREDIVDNNYIFISENANSLQEKLNMVLSDSYEEVLSNSFAKYGKWDFSYYLEQFVNAISQIGRYR